MDSLISKVREWSPGLQELRYVFKDPPGELIEAMEYAQMGNLPIMLDGDLVLVKVIDVEHEEGDRLVITAFGDPSPRYAQLAGHRIVKVLAYGA